VLVATVCLCDFAVFGPKLHRRLISFASTRSTRLYLHGSELRRLHVVGPLAILMLLGNACGLQRLCIDRAGLRLQTPTFILSDDLSFAVHLAATLGRTIEVATLFLLLSLARISVHSSLIRQLRPRRVVRILKSDFASLDRNDSIDYVL